MKYGLILADPPWQFSNKKTGGSMKSGATNQYSCMTIDDLKLMDVQSISADDCILVMWWVGSMPQEAIDLVSAWGFKLKNMNGFVWKKLTKKGLPFFGMGFWTRAGSESCIVAIKGKPQPASRSVRAVFESKARSHSEKPEEIYSLCKEMAGDVPMLDMFSRKSRDGWDCFGDEVDGSIEIAMNNKG